MANIIKEILKDLPEEKISDAVFEGANIVLYTKNKDFFLDNEGMIKKAVDTIKKRIELRPDPSIVMEQETAEKKIREILPDEAGVAHVLFDPHRSIVVIEAEKLGLAIGKQGSLLQEIRKETLWVPVIRRTPAIRSKIIENIRAVLYQYSDYRRKFLDKIGHRIYDGWIREKKNEWIRLTMLGGGRQVGRSCLFLQTPESRVLLDCGVDVASQDSPYPYLESPEFNIDQLDAVVISHAHLDHVGFLPYLFKFGYRGPVYCTAPTRDVAGLLLLDFVKIMKSENKEPLFDVEDVKETMKHTVTLEYDEVTDITPDVRVTLYNAGHTLGSAMIHMHVGNGLHNILYTGDMKFGKTAVLEPSSTVFPRLETLIIESTYGGREVSETAKEENDSQFVEMVTDTLKNGGKVLVPVLGSGRAQELLLSIHHFMFIEKSMPKVPVYIDGLVWDITAIHTAYPEYMNATIRKLIFHKDQNPFLAPVFKEVGSQKERKQIIDSKEPCVILATSGMLVGGPSVEYLKALGGNKKNSLAIVSYQGEGSLGRRIQRGDREISFLTGTKQELLKINCRVETFEEFSAHSNRKQLLDFIYKCSPRPKKVIVNHGDPSRCLELASNIHKLMRIETNAPKNLEAVRLK
jgi:uncharacterized protein